MVSRLSKLAAVNQILSACGQKPTNTIVDSTSRWTLNALAVLDETDRQVQSEGWYFNTDPDYTFSADAITGEVELPVSAVKFKPHEEHWIVQRGQKMYDRQKGTFAIGRALSGYLVSFLDFEDIPESAKKYITCRAALKTYDRYVGSDENRQSLLMELREARAELMDEHCEFGQFSMLDDPTMPWIEGSSWLPPTPRNHPLY